MDLSRLPQQLDDGATIIKRDPKWRALPYRTRDAAIPDWPAWITDDEWYPLYDDTLESYGLKTRYEERLYALSLTRTRGSTNSATISCKFNALQTCPGGWLWTNMAAPSSVSTSDELANMLRSLPERVSELDPAIRYRDLWTWAGDKALVGSHLTWEAYEPEDPLDHDHCHICGATISLVDADAYQSGYVIDDGKFEGRWICPGCRTEYADVFGFIVDDPSISEQSGG